MNPLRSHFRLNLECLENRDNPSNLSATFANHTLTITGETANTLTVEGNVGDATQFTISSSGTDTFNSKASPYSSPTGVQNITFSLTGDNETVTFDNAVRAINLAGNLTINAGNGAHTINTANLTVGKNFTISDGVNSSVVATNNLRNLNVGGNLTVSGGSGTFLTQIERTSAGNSIIGGNLSISYGAGFADAFISDLNVGGSVTIIKGPKGSTGASGNIQFFNVINTGFHSVIKGNVSISVVSGSELFDVLDYEVEGNMTLQTGSGEVQTIFGAFRVDKPAVVEGNLTVSGTGANSLTVGGASLVTGLIVGKNLSITTGTGNNALALNLLQVGGATNLLVGSGTNTVSIDNSLFEGTFSLKTGAGTNTLKVEMNSTDTMPTEFDMAAVISFGKGTNTGQIAFEHTTSNQEVFILNSFVVSGQPILEQDSTQEIFPFGNSIVLK
jgi:hypothetical protein